MAQFSLLNLHVASQHSIKKIYFEIKILNFDRVNYIHLTYGVPAVFFSKIADVYVKEIKIKGVLLSKNG